MSIHEDIDMPTPKPAPQDERRKRLEQQTDAFVSDWRLFHAIGPEVKRSLVSLLEREIDAAVGQERMLMGAIVDQIDVSSGKQACAGTCISAVRYMQDHLGIDWKVPPAIRSRREGEEGPEDPEKGRWDWQDL